MNKTTLTATLVRIRETKNCIVFDELPASADAKPAIRSPLYLPKDTPGFADAVAIEVCITVTGRGATTPAPAPDAKADARQPVVSGK